MLHAGRVLNRRLLGKILNILYRYTGHMVFGNSGYDGVCPSCDKAVDLEPLEAKNNDRHLVWACEECETIIGVT
jgi:hypothetical protein